MSNLYKQHISYSNLSQQITTNVVGTRFFHNPRNPTTPNLHEYIPANYILSLTKSQQRIFTYLLRFRPRGVFRLYMAEIAQYSNCSIKTAQRATNKFHDDGVITKIQTPNCFSSNVFTIDNNKIYNIDKSDSMKMSDINININNLYTNTNSTDSRVRAKRLSVFSNESSNMKLEINESLKILSDKIGLTDAGKIDLIGFPEESIKFVLSKLKITDNTKDIFRVACFYAHLWCKENKQRPILSKTRELSVLFNVNVDDKRTDRALIKESKKTYQKSNTAKGSEVVLWSPREPMKPSLKSDVIQKANEFVKTDLFKMLSSWTNITPEQHITKEVERNDLVALRYAKWYGQYGNNNFSNQQETIILES